MRFNRKFIIHFILIALVALTSSCLYTQKDIDKAKRDAERATIEKLQPIIDSIKIAEFNAGEIVGEQNAIAQQRKEQFIEVSWLGIKKLFPESVIFGANLFLISFTCLLLWRVFSPELNSYMAEKIREFKWSMLKQMDQQRKLKAVKQRWEYQLEDISAKLVLAEKTKEVYEDQITKIQAFIDTGIPKEQIDVEQKTIENLSANIEDVNEKIAKGNRLQLSINNIIRSHELKIYKLHHGLQDDQNEVGIDFIDVEEDIKFYLKFDV